MIRRQIDRIQSSLARKITAWVMLSLVLMIIMIIAGAHWITANFYQDHLKGEVYERLTAHMVLLHDDQNESVYSYLNRLETGKHSSLIVFNEELEPVYSSERVREGKTEDYIRFITTYEEEIYASDGQVYVEEVDTAIPFHIPHAWGAGLMEGTDGQLSGYVFIDQDTGELNSARINLLILLIIMGVITFFLGLLFVSYLTKRISNPLDEMSRKTRNIADGDFDIEVKVYGKDEVGRLGGNIRQMTRQLKEYRDSRREFISHVSHDLRTPITYIKGYSALMKDAGNMAEKDRKRNVTVIYEEANRMERLVADLFLLTKLQEGKIRLHTEPVNLDEWLPGLMESRAIMFDQKQITAELDIGEEFSERSVSLDKFRMEQALINLLENAIRFTEVKGKITLSCFEENGTAVFKVADTGVGMDGDEVNKIWERFYKADPSRSRNDSGTGLGLAIVKEIAEAHGGTVRVSSMKNEGTSFYLYIPLKNDQ